MTQPPNAERHNSASFALRLRHTPLPPPSCSAETVTNANNPTALNSQPDQVGRGHILNTSMAILNGAGSRVRRVHHFIA